MTNIINIPDREPQDRRAIEDEARAWLVQLDGTRPSPEDLAEFQDWLARSPVHRESFRHAAEAWQRLDALAGILDRTYTADEHNAQAGEGITPGLLGRLCSRPAAAVLLFLVTLSGVLAIYLHAPEPVPHTSAFTAEYVTDIGEMRSVTLPDGSEIRMNTDSRMEIAYRNDARIIRLAKGEAWFDVFHDSDRPFLVHAGRIMVRAVGTAFSVFVRDDRIDLTITDGRVEAVSLDEEAISLSELDPDFPARALSRIPLAQGQHVVFDDEIELIQRVEPAEIEKRLAWRDGMLLFDNDPLEEVVNKINRYTPVKIVISDSDIRDMRFGGYFRTSDVDSILATLEEGFGIRAERINPNLVYLSQRRDHGVGASTSTRGAETP